MKDIKKHIFIFYILKCFRGLLRDRTVIFTTHQPRFAVDCDAVLCVKDNCVSTQDSVQEFQNLRPQNTEADKDFSTAVDKKEPKDESEGIQEDSERDEEGREVGSLSWGVFSGYGRAVGAALCVGVATAVVAMQTARNLSDLWLAHWVEAVANGSSDNGISLESSSVLTSSVFTTSVLDGDGYGSLNGSGSNLVTYPVPKYLATGSWQRPQLMLASLVSKKLGKKS